MKRIVLLLLALASLAVVVAESRTPATGGSRGAQVGQAAPEVTGGPWINSAPLSMEGLRGRVVLVEFWTYG